MQTLVAFLNSTECDIAPCDSGVCDYRVATRGDEVKDTPHPLSFRIDADICSARVSELSPLAH